MELVEFWLIFGNFSIYDYQIKFCTVRFQFSNDQLQLGY